MSIEKDLIKKFMNEGSSNKYYVCRRPFNVGMGAWIWTVKPKTIFKIDKDGFWWEYNFQIEKYTPMYAYNGAKIQFNLSNYGAVAP